MVSLLDLVHGMEKLTVAGEAHGGGHGATAPASASGQPSATPFPQRTRCRPFEDRRPGNRDTPSLAVLLKNPWRIEYSTRSPKVPE